MARRKKKASACRPRRVGFLIVFAVAFLLISCSTGVVSGAATTKRKSSTDQKSNDNDNDKNDDIDDRVERLKQSPRYEPPGPRVGTDKAHGNLLQSSSSSPAKQAAYAPLRKQHPSQEASLTTTVASNNHRMTNYTLTQQAEYLSQQQQRQQQAGKEYYTTFEVLLQMEERRQEQEKRNQQTGIVVHHPANSNKMSPIFWSVLGSASLLSVSSFWRDPSTAHHLWTTSVQKKVGAVLAVAWLPWIWARPAQLPFFDLIILVQLGRNPTVQPFLQQEVLPMIWKTVKAMMVHEAWSRAWKWFFVQCDTLRQSMSSMKEKEEMERETNHATSSTDVSNNEEKEIAKKSSFAFDVLRWPNDSPPEWLVTTHSAIVGSIRKGIKSNFKKSVQETIATSASVWRKAFQEQVQLLKPWEPVGDLFVKFVEALVAR